MSNITFETNCPQVARPPLFFVTATSSIDGRNLTEGDHVLIDPEAVPVAGKLVLVGESLEDWSGQAGIAGVAVSVSREM